MEYDHRQGRMHGQFTTRLLASKYDQLDELITRESYDLESSTAQERKTQGSFDARRKQTDTQSGGGGEDRAGKLKQQSQTSSSLLEAVPVVGRNLDDLFSHLKQEQQEGGGGNDNNKGPRKMEELRCDVDRDGYHIV